MSRAELLNTRLGEAAEMCRALRQDPGVTVTAENIVDAVVASIRGGGKVLLCGNGGSAADAQHLAAELLGRFYIDRRPFPAIALADNVSALTAIGNDYAYADVFSRGVRGLGREGDTLITFSTSGRSENVIAAMKAAHELSMVTAAFVGAPGSPAGELADHCLCVPSTRTAGVQEGHIILGHAVFEMIESELCA